MHSKFCFERENGCAIFALTDLNPGFAGHRDTLCINSINECEHLTATIFESRPMPTP